MTGFSPQNQVERHATADDVVMHYRLFLAREPECPEVVAEKTWQTLPTLVAGAAGSDEFYETVILNIVRGAAPPHALRSRGPEPNDLEWAARVLPLEPSARTRLTEVRTWRQFFDLLFRDAAFRQFVPTLNADPALVDSVLNSLSRDIIGAIELCIGAELKGWAANQMNLTESVALEILADGDPVGIAQCDHFRGDLKQILGTGGHFGFHFTLPPSLRLRGKSFHVSAVDLQSRQPIGGACTVSLSRESDLGALEEVNRRLAEIEAALKTIRAQIPSISLLTSYSLQRYDDYVRHVGAVDAMRRARHLTEAATFTYRPLVAIVLRTADRDPVLLEGSLRSVSRQTYDRWELLVCDASPGRAAEVSQTVGYVFCDDGRVKRVRAGHPGGYSACLNRAISSAEGDYLCFLEAGDELTDDALFSVVQSLQKRRSKVLYSDEDRVSSDASARPIFHSPYFKPDFDWDLLIGQNYLARFLVVETALARSVGGFHAQYDGVQDHDFVLRCLEKVAGDDVRHVCRVLYHWRMAPEASYEAAGRPEQAEKLRLACVNDHLERQGVRARAEPLVDAFHGPRKGAVGLTWALPNDPPAVSIIVPTRDRADLLSQCLTNLRGAIDAYKGPCEIIVVDNESTEPDARRLLDSVQSPKTRVVPYNGPFNWSVINNEAVRVASGGVLLFLNNDAFVREAGSLSRIVAQAVRPDVGAVGARLLYQDGAVQHAGILLGVDGHAGHDGVGLHAADPGYFGRHHLAHEASAVTGACLATRRAVFEQVGGFDPGFAVTCNDADYCLRVGERGYKTIYDPSVVLYHLESRTRSLFDSPAARDLLSAEEVRFRSRWSAKVKRDPFYNPHFERHFTPFARIRLFEDREIS